MGHYRSELYEGHGSLIAQHERFERKQKLRNALKDVLWSELDPPCGELEAFFLVLGLIPGREPHDEHLSIVEQRLRWRISTQD